VESVDLIATDDLGSSSTRSIFRSKDGNPSLLMMPPEVIEISRESLDLYKSGRTSTADPHNEAWIQYKGHHYAVGFLAKREFGACMNYKAVKYENAIRKILATVGAIAAKERLPNRFRVALGTLLPRIEYENRAVFERGLSEALSDFSFRDRHYSVELEHFLCRPEGGGLIWSRSYKLGASARSMVIVGLMLGYRDASVEIIDHGVASGVSSKLGQLSMIQRVMSRTSGQEEQNLLEAIYQAGSTISPQKFRHLVCSESREFAAEEELQIAEAVKVSRNDYWRRLLEWLKSVLPGKIDLVVIGGGTAEYLRPELEKHFRGTSLSWAAELEEDVRLAFNIPESENHLCMRLTDVYGLFRLLYQQVNPSELRTSRKA
jgi:hypothetical protein